MRGSWFATYRGLILALAVATVLEAVVVVRQSTVTADAITFVSMAKELPQHTREVFARYDQHPGYPLMMMAASRLVRAAGCNADPETWTLAGLLVACVCGVLSVAVVWCLARELMGERVANLSALIFAILPMPRIHAADAISDTPHLLAYVTAAWLATMGVVNGNAWLLAGAGAASGVAYWIRPEGLAVALCAWLAVACVGWRQKWPVRRLAVSLSVLAASTLAVAAPYPLLAGKITSKQHPIERAREATTIIASVAADSTPAPAANDAPVPAAAAPVPAAPPTVAAAPTPNPVAAGPTWTRRILHSIDAYFNSASQGFKWVFLPFCIVGHLSLRRSGVDARQFGFIASLAATHSLVLLTLVAVAGYLAHRHFLPILALAMPLTAWGVIVVGKWIAERAERSERACVVGLLCVCAAVVVPYTVRPMAREFQSVIDATRWVQTHMSPGAAVVTNSPYVQFYGHMPVAFLGTDTPTLEAAIAQSPAPTRCEYVVLHVKAHAYQPQWYEQVEQRYTPVQEFPDSGSGRPGMKTVVFVAKR